MVDDVFRVSGLNLEDVFICDYWDVMIYDVRSYFNGDGLILYFVGFGSNFEGMFGIFEWDIELF